MRSKPNLEPNFSSNASELPALWVINTLSELNLTDWLFQLEPNLEWHQCLHYIDEIIHLSEDLCFRLIMLFSVVNRLWQLEEVNLSKQLHCMKNYPYLRHERDENTQIWTISQVSFHSRENYWVGRVSSAEIIKLFYLLRKNAYFWVQ